MQLERIYYTFPLQQGVELFVEVSDGDAVEYGATGLPFVADGQLALGETLQFDQTFVLHVPGRSEVQVGTPPRDPIIVPDRESPDRPPPPQEPEEE